MDGDKNKKGGHGLQNTVERERDKEAAASERSTEQDGGRGGERNFGLDTQSLQNKRVYFDHDYATDMQNKRKEYTPVKKALKENGVRFQTPLTTSGPKPPGRSFLC